MKILQQVFLGLLFSISNRPKIGLSIVKNVLGTKKLGCYHPSYGLIIISYN